MSRNDQELLEAAKENNLAEVSRLLRAGADINVKDNNGNIMPLHWACMKGHVHVVIEFLEHGADIESTTSYGRTPLYFACANGHVAVVNELLSRGANTEVKDHLGDTPLHDASWNGHVEIAHALLSGGADILAANNRGELPIRIAANVRHLAVTKCLLQHFYATTRRLPLHELLKDLTWIGSPYRSDSPPLRLALHHEVLGTDDVEEIVEYLVSRNPALLSSRDQDGALPLHVACRRGAAFTIVQSLVYLYKASVKSLTSGGDLPLFLACETPETSLDTIFLLMKLYPDLVY
jgi:ankyrin repeat protein